MILCRFEEGDGWGKGGKEWSKWMTANCPHQTDAQTIAFFELTIENFIGDNKWEKVSNQTGIKWQFKLV